MCLSLLATNDSLGAPKTLDDANSGKRRKMDRNDSPNSSIMFDVTQLVDALEKEVGSSPSLSLAPAESASPSSESSLSCYLPSSSSKSSLSCYESSFDFCDIFNAPVPPTWEAEEEKSATVSTTPFIKKRGSLGKRNRSLHRSQTVTSNLCDLAEVGN